MAEDTVARYSHREGNVNVVLLIIWSDKTKGERLGSGISTQFGQTFMSTNLKMLQTTQNRLI